MKKILAVITLLLFAAAQTAMAGGVALTDSAMDNIAAGDWVVIQDEFGNQEVVEVWHSGNDIDLTDDSQTQLQAVNNANAVDSAIAAQTNIARVTGDPLVPTENVKVEGFNEADLLNYSPAESGIEYGKDVKSSSENHSESCNLSLGLSVAKSESCSFNKSESETLIYDETLDINGAYASSMEGEDKNCETEGVETCTLIVDYDKDIDYVKEDSFGKTKEKSCNIGLGVTAGCMTQTESSETTTKEVYKEHRNNLSENNHLDLEDTSQTQLMAVSNLNAVGSAAAMQTNIASNVGVNGSITGYNSATVVNGL